MMGARDMLSGLWNFPREVSRHGTATRKSMRFTSLKEMAVIVGDDKTKTSVRAGDAVYIQPCENHMFMNTGEGMMKMICTVPIFSGKTGKETTSCDE